MEQDNKAQGLDGGGRVVKNKREGEAVSMTFIGKSSGQIPSRHIGFFNQKNTLPTISTNIIAGWSMARFDQIVERYNYVNCNYRTNRGESSLEKKDEEKMKQQ
ncbi:hypothetical protein CFP56_000386 [Quercus suber]|uniref:Uncharacterized protein n=1 Tax=Quercus suber TaxID=58331 RepID=A0AAW0M8F8_QUESU|nr:hypothetical protein CFP56_27093 [Quercus suber]